MSELRMNAGAAGAIEPREYHLAEEPHPANGTALGFWLYLMSDCLIFAALFATYGVLGRSYAAGPTGADLFDLPLVAMNTAFLLLSSITFGFAMLKKQQRQVGATLGWLAVTGVLGNSMSSRTCCTRARARAAAPSCRRSSRSSARTVCTSLSA